MPDKSKHGKRKHPHLSKKSRAKQRHGTIALQQPVATEPPRPAAAFSTPPSSRASVSPATPRAVQYPYITAELRSIGILAGIILVILIVLSLVLS